MSNLSRRNFFRTAGFCVSTLTLTGCLAPPKTARTKQNSRPNIILIMSDDMGFSDIGCYGGEIRTPNLDALAANGLRFTQFYNTARCCPTRASLLTGLYQHQAGIGHMMNDRKLEGYTGNLNNKCVTIAQVMKTGGYSTYMSGKWHVTKHTEPNGPKHNWPCQRGFDRFFGTIHGAGSFYDPNTLTRDNKMIAPDSDDFYYTDAISDNAVNYISDHTKQKTDDPFFMYVAYTAAHWPMHAREADIEKYKGMYDKGWDWIRQERMERLKKMGLIDKSWNITPRDEGIPAWEDAQNKDWHKRRMEVYAAMVTVMDEGIGRIVDELKRTGKLENTLIFFLQDNGGCAEESGSKGPITPDPKKPVELKPMVPGQLQTRMRPTVTRDGRPVRTGIGVMPGADDTFVAYGKPWANASNTPFRLYKHWVHEGGISTPLIVHWPAAIKAKGSLRNQPGHLIDIMATCVDVFGANYPAEFNGEKIHPMEGRSLTPAFNDKPIQRQAIYFEHEGNRAIRQGKWKLVAKGPKGQWELYDMNKDRTELNNLAEEHPEKAKQLAQMWNQWAQRANVLPWPWNKKKQKKKKK